MVLDSRKYLTPAERDKLLAWITQEAIIARAKGHLLGPRDEAMFTIALAAALRASELAAVKVGDVRFDRGHFHLVVQRGKGGKRREVALPAALRPFLRGYLDWMERADLSIESGAPLFPSRIGKHLTRNGVWRRWTTLLERAGISHRPLHASRHTSAVTLYRATRDLRLVQKQLGHARITTTQVYADVLPEDVQAGVNAAWSGLK